MDREISQFSSLGTVLIAVAAFIVLAFSIFQLTKEQANNGSVGMQDALSQVSAQQFQDYDQKTVTGFQVLSGIKMVENKPYAVLIATKAFNRKESTLPKEEHPSVYIVKDAGATAGTTDDIYFINYNGILKGVAGDTATNVKPANVASGGATVNNFSTADNLTITKKNGYYLADAGFNQTDGNIVYDTTTLGVNKAGSAEYLSSNSKYSATLIKNEAGEIVGMVFIQL